jgi:hypothetical protein
VFMAIIADLKARLLREACIAVGETPFYSSTDTGATYLETLLGDAIVAHNPNLVVATLPDKEITLVMLLARVKICHLRAQKMAGESNLSGTGGYGTDRNTPFYKLMALAKELKAEYIALAAQLGVDVPSDQPQGQVTVSSLLIESGGLGVRTPLRVNMPPCPVLTLTSADTSAGSILLTWVIPDFEDFRRYRVALISFPIGEEDAHSVLDPANSFEESEIPGILQSATIMDLALLQSARAVGLSGLDLSNKNYAIVLVVENTVGNISLSNQILTGGTLALPTTGVFEGQNFRVVNGVFEWKIGDSGYRVTPLVQDDVAQAPLNQTPEE